MKRPDQEFRDEYCNEDWLVLVAWIEHLEKALEAAKVYGRLESYDAIEHRAAIDKALGGEE